MFVVESEEDFRRVLREEMRVLVQEAARSAPKEEDDLISYKRAAARIDASISTIRALVRRGILTRYGDGKGSRVSRSELLSVMAQRGAAAKAIRNADAVAEGIVNKSRKKE